MSAFCEDYLDVESMAQTGPDEADPTPWVEGMTTGWEGLKTSAPDEVASEITVMADMLLEPIAKLDEEGFFAVNESEDFVAAAAKVDSYLLDRCGWESIDVRAVDYRFEADFDSTKPGVVGFRFENAGVEMHEMALVRINDGVTESIDELLAMPEEEAEARTEFITFAFGAPGAKDTVFADLKAGRYVVLCFVPIGSTSLEAVVTADGPPHLTQGMVAEFTVGA